MEKHEYANYFACNEASRQILIAAQSEKWDEALILEHELTTLFSNISAVDWTCLSTSQRDDLVACFEEIKNNLANTESLFLSRKDVLSTFLLQANNANKINKAYSSS